MCESNYFTKANAIYLSAKSSIVEGINQKYEDLKNYGCYSIQQSLECLIKYYLSIYGKEIPQQHNLALLLDKCNDDSIIIPFTNYIYDNLDEISSRNVGARYEFDLYIGNTKAKRVLYELGISINNIVGDLKENNLGNYNEVEVIELNERGR